MNNQDILREAVYRSRLVFEELAECALIGTSVYDYTDDDNPSWEEIQSGISILGQEDEDGLLSLVVGRLKTIPERAYLDNGDPGYPSETILEDIEIENFDYDTSLAVAVDMAKLAFKCFMKVLTNKACEYYDHGYGFEE